MTVLYEHKLCPGFLKALSLTCITTTKFLDAEKILWCQGLGTRQELSCNKNHLKSSFNSCADKFSGKKKLAIFSHKYFLISYSLLLENWKCQNTVWKSVVSDLGRNQEILQTLQKSLLLWEFEHPFPKWSFRKKTIQELSAEGFLVENKVFKNQRFLQGTCNMVLTGEWGHSTLNSNSCEASQCLKKMHFSVEWNLNWF